MGSEFATLVIKNVSVRFKSSEVSRLSTPGASIVRLFLFAIRYANVIHCNVFSNWKRIICGESADSP